ncbi:MAG TPA: formate dehydrogenase accessory sulfurtransferase FdhD [Chloroflexota bacterium]|nr:formate dehydrogenase accessory sulfurtransferase FdhD [Chloroflexota bacterium]
MTTDIRVASSEPALERSEGSRVASGEGLAIGDSRLELETPAAVIPRRYVRFRADTGQAVEEAVIAEIRLTIFVDGQELVQLMCSPHQLNALVVGFLYLEGLIETVDDVDCARVCLEDRVAEVRLGRRLLEVPKRKIITSGCTGGMSFGLYLEELQRFRVADGLVRIEPGRVYGLLRQLHEHAHLYRKSGGVHTSLLADSAGEVLVVAEDIGRHNTLDKIEGECLLRGIATAGRVIIASGRISSEMLLKAAIMGVPIVGSRTSPTQLAITMAELLNITVIGYIRSASMNVYTHPWRILGAPTA